jgi:hypothetical protein
VFDVQIEFTLQPTGLFESPSPRISATESYGDGPSTHGTRFALARICRGDVDRQRDAGPTLRPVLGRNVATVARCHRTNDRET